MRAELDSNCISFVLSHFGVAEDQYIPPDCAYPEIVSNFGIVAPTQADSLMVVSEIPDNFYVYHMALIDPKKPLWVVHRPRSGVRVIREPMAAALENYATYLKRADCYLRFLRFLGQAPDEFPKVPDPLLSLLPRPLRSILKLD